VDAEKTKFVTRRRFLKSTALGIGLLAAAPLLQACSQAAAPVTTQAPAQAEPTKAPEAAATKAPSAQKITLNMLTPLPPDPAPPAVADYGKEAFAAWQEKTGITMKQEVVPWTDQHDKLATSFAANDATYDVIYSCEWCPEFSNYLIPVDDYIAQDKLRADIPEATPLTTSWKGKNYGQVFCLSLLLLWYNTEMFQQAGLDPTKPPTNWDEWVKAGIATTKGGVYGMVAGWMDGAMGQHKAHMVEVDPKANYWDDAGMPIMNNPAAVEALQWMVDAIHKHKFMDPQSVGIGGIAAEANVFLSAKAAMVEQWSFVYKQSQKADVSVVKDKVAVTIMPGKAPVRSGSLDGTDAYAITKTNKYPDAGWEYIRFVVSPEMQKQMFLQTGWVPIRNSVRQDPEVIKADPVLKAMDEQARYPHPGFIIPEGAAFGEIWKNEVTDVLKNKRPAKEALDAVVANSRKLIEQRTKG